MNFFQKRRARKTAREMLRHARHFQHMREDLMPQNELNEIRSRAEAVRNALADTDVATQESASDALHDWLVEHSPRRAMSGLRENVEILAVAIAVAMACRTYFIQPFKIPTGSMQPTLYGIQYNSLPEPGIMDRMPLKLAKWVVTGSWYKEIKARESGQLTFDQAAYHPKEKSFYIGNRRYDIPREGSTDLHQYVTKGTVLWRGLKVAGDHVFVNKVKWNFQHPKRGQIVVFTTRGITVLEEGLQKDKHGNPISAHYIKRMVGIPGDIISIKPPDLMINGRRHIETKTIARVASKQGKYLGYKLGGYMSSTVDQLKLGPDEYCAFGDNTANSKDSRYWGAVPEMNLVGPAFFIYWPFSERWGIAR